MWWSLIAGFHWLYTLNVLLHNPVPDRAKKAGHRGAFSAALKAERANKSVGIFVKVFNDVAHSEWP